jgi:aminoglycoside 3-N-acetyltransferase
MEDEVLFTDSRGREYTREDVLQCLKSVGADRCKTLFIHTDIAFGRLAPSLGRKGYLQALYDTLLALQVETLIFPAFTYSFCNGETYDVRNSRTSMGALAEYARKQPGAIRTLDPLLSFAVIGSGGPTFKNHPLGNHSLGLGSKFDLLHQQEDVKFLFFGADFSGYFTYVHHIEKVMDVPYRYDQAFTGTIIDENGNAFEHTHMIHTQCGGVTLKGYGPMKADLERRGLLLAAPLGNLEVVCVSEEDAYREVTRRLREDPYSFVQPYKDADLTHKYTFGKNGERVTHC